MASAWASDVPISMPRPLDPSLAAAVDMNGFTWTFAGLRHNLNAVDAERLGKPSLAPPVRPQNIVYGDEAADSVEYL
jgi:hypothetical protein